MPPSADHFFKDADFIFQQDLAPAHTAKSTKSWLNDHGVGVLDWPANSPDLNPIDNLCVMKLHGGARNEEARNFFQKHFNQHGDRWRQVHTLNDFKTRQRHGEN